MFPNHPNTRVESEDINGTETGNNSLIEDSSTSLYSSADPDDSNVKVPEYSESTQVSRIPSFVANNIIETSDRTQQDVLTNAQTNSTIVGVTLPNQTCGCESNRPFIVTEFLSLARNVLDVALYIIYNCLDWLADCVCNCDVSSDCNTHSNDCFKHVSKSQEIGTTIHTRTFKRSTGAERDLCKSLNKRVKSNPIQQEQLSIVSAAKGQSPTSYALYDANKLRKGNDNAGNFIKPFVSHQNNVEVDLPRQKSLSKAFINPQVMSKRSSSHSSKNTPLFEVDNSLVNQVSVSTENVRRNKDDDDDEGPDLDSGKDDILEYLDSMREELDSHVPLDFFQKDVPELQRDQNLRNSKSHLNKSFQVPSSNRISKSRTSNPQEELSVFEKQSSITSIQKSQEHYLDSSQEELPVSEKQSSSRKSKENYLNSIQEELPVSEKQSSSRKSKENYLNSIQEELPVSKKRNSIRKSLEHQDDLKSYQCRQVKSKETNRIPDVLSSATISFSFQNGTDSSYPPQPQLIIQLPLTNNRTCNELTPQIRGYPNHPFTISVPQSHGGQTDSPITGIHSIAPVSTELNFGNRYDISQSNRLEDDSSIASSSEASTSKVGASGYEADDEQSERSRLETTYKISDREYQKKRRRERSLKKDKERNQNPQISSSQEDDTD